MKRNNKKPSFVHNLVFKKTMFTGIILATLMCFCPLAQAAESSKDKTWDFQLAPFYLWAVSMSGDMTVKGRATLPVEVDFKDAFDNLEAAFTGHFEAWWKRQWGFLVDVYYINLGGKQQIGPLTTFKVDLENVITELGGFYRFLNGVHQMDALAGIRYFALDVELDVQPTPVNIDKNKHWTDPIVGARYVWQASERWKLVFRGDIGGFGAGSDFAWNVQGLVLYQPWKHVGFILGYRVMDVDYEDGSGLDKFAYDVTMYGPVLGINIAW